MCIKPLTLKDRVVECGQCAECRIKKSREWAFRVEQEAKTADTGAFITLTYDETHAIWIDHPDTDETYTTLDKSDFQKFMKRLRKEISKTHDVKLRYFACGEYGPSTSRAHYHAIIFNIPIEYKNQETIERVWSKGFVTVLPVESKSIRYVTNYMMMKDDNLKKGQLKPFTLMSRNPGLGQYYPYANAKTHRKTFSPLLNEATQNKRPLIRYYADRIFPGHLQANYREMKEEYFKPFHNEQLKKATEEDPLDPASVIKRKKLEKLRAIRARQKKRKL